MNQYVLVLDFGAQYTQLIARRVRELGVYSEIRPCTDRPDQVDLTQVAAIILSGGPASVLGADAPQFDQSWLETGRPTLGICYGMQVISQLFGAEISSGTSREYGHALLEIVDDEDLFSGFDLESQTSVWMSHGDHVESVAPGFRLLARSDGAPIAAIGDSTRKMYAVQFHPEVIHTPRGKEILGNFVFKIAGCDKNWSSKGFIESSVGDIKNEVDSDANVICGLSGGVDSSVAAVLVSRAIGDRLHCIFVDNGLLRKNEGDQVVKRLGESGLGLTIHRVNAGERFLSELEGVTDPEQKRKIIGRVFIEVFDDAAKSIPNVTHLVQGTLYPDVIESVSVKGPSATIKSHHNVGGLPETMKLKLIEPFRELFKDEVRGVGRELDIADEILLRQPFPGPGLAVRVIGEIKESSIKLLQDADYIFQEEIRSEGLYRELWQSFAVLLPISTVGVMGDDRTYEQVVALRAVHSEDGMTADWAYLPEDLLRRVSNRIINEVKGVNRVVFDISSKPPATIEWE